jgi:two-component system chemotaxis response regulator CheY
MKLRALIVEDCSVMRKLLIQALPATGLAEFKFTEADNGASALAKFDPKTTDIVFVDWNMPGMSGIDFVRKIRASGKTDHVPIVMVTGNGTAGNIEEALDEARADVYITKPYTVDDLRRKLTKLVDRVAQEQGKRCETKRPGLLSRVLGGMS